MNALSAGMTEQQARCQVVEVARRLTEQGLNHGSTGNVSMRWDRGSRAGFLVTPSATPAHEVQAEDMVWLPILESDPLDGLIDEDAAPLVVDRRKPSSEAPLHRAMYRHCGAQAVVHSHAPFATTLACLPKVQNEGIPAFHYMIAMAGGDSIRCARYQTFGSQALADSVVEAMHERLACLMASHGLIAIGKDLVSAADLAVEVEYLSRVYFQTLQIGEPSRLDQAEMSKVLQGFTTYRR